MVLIFGELVLKFGKILDLFAPSTPENSTPQIFRSLNLIMFLNGKSSIVVRKSVMMLITLPFGPYIKRHICSKKEREGENTSSCDLIFNHHHSDRKLR